MSICHIKRGSSLSNELVINAKLKFFLQLALKFKVYCVCYGQTPATD